MVGPQFINYHPREWFVEDDGAFEVYSNVLSQDTGSSWESNTESSWEISSLPYFSLGVQMNRVARVKAWFRSTRLIIEPNLSSSFKLLY